MWQKHEDIACQSKRQSRWKKPQEKEFGEMSADNTKPYNCDKDGKIYPNSPFMTQYMFVCTFKKSFQVIKIKIGPSKWQNEPMTVMHKIIRVYVRRSMGMMLEMYPPSNLHWRCRNKAAKDILPTVSFKIKFEDTEPCKASCMGEKRKYKKTPFNSPASHQLRPPEIAKNVVITNAEMDPIKSNIDGQAMTGTFDKTIIVAAAFFDIFNLLSPQERDESRTFLLT